MLQENEIVTAHGVGAFWQKPILAKNARGERTPDPLSQNREGGDGIFLWCFRGAKKTIMSHFYTKSNMFLTEMRHR